MKLESENWNQRSQSLRSKKYSTFLTKQRKRILLYQVTCHQSSSTRKAQAWPNLQLKSWIISLTSSCTIKFWVNFKQQSQILLIINKDSLDASTQSALKYWRKSTMCLGGYLKFLWDTCQDEPWKSDLRDMLEKRKTSDNVEQDKVRRWECGSGLWSTEWIRPICCPIYYLIFYRVALLAPLMKISVLIGLKPESAFQIFCLKQLNFLKMPETFFSISRFIQGEAN